MDQLPAIGSKHVTPRGRDIDAKRGTGCVEGVVDLGKHSIAPIGRRLATEDRQDRAPFEPVICLWRARGLQEGRDQIDGLDEGIGGRAAGCVRLRARIIDDKRHTNRAFVKQLLLAQPVVAQVIAVIGGDDDHRLARLAGFLQPIE